MESPWFVINVLPYVSTSYQLLEVGPTTNISYSAAGILIYVKA